MKKYNYNKEYKICINFDGGTYDYYLEKKGYGDLFYMFGVQKLLEPTKFEKGYIDLYLKQAKIWKFWR